MNGVHPEVLAAAMSFRAVGATSPSRAATKLGHLLRPPHPGERIAVVVGDALRCSSTVCACLAAGAAGVVVSVKGGGGPTPETVRRLGDALGLPTVLGGELHGRAVPGGVLANSPREARSDLLEGRVLHFFSTNFGRCLAEVVVKVTEYHEQGGSADVLLATFANADSVAARLRNDSYERVFLCMSGFYDHVSLEDDVLGGQILERIHIPFTDMDDEARSMVASARMLWSPEEQTTAFRTGWIGRCLERFGMAADIPAVVSGEGIAEPVRERMKFLVPELRWWKGLAVFATAAFPPGRVNWRRKTPVLKEVSP